MSWLRVLRLRNNRFSSSIPIELCQMVSLQIMDLAENSFTGVIPSCLGSLTAMTTKRLINYDGEPFSSFNSYEWAEEDLVVMIKGKALEYKNSLRVVVIIDLSGNNLVGIIPPELTLLSQLIGLNLAYNHLNGTIPQNIGDLTSLESLDLSNNQLSGNIPNSLSIPTLAYLNLSYNYLSGKIPMGTQLQTLTDTSIYDGNPSLCGTPLTKICPGQEHEEDDDEGGKFDQIWLYLAITSGYAVGLWGFFAILMIKKEWRYAYFQYIDYAKDWLYVFIAIKAARVKAKMRGQARV